MPRDSHILAQAIDFPWALTKPMVKTVAHVIARHVMYGKADAVELIRQDQPAPPPPGNGIALITLRGVFASHANLLSDVSGTATFEDAIAAVKAATRDPQIGTIILDWHSPGGSVCGATEFAAVILAARAVKRVISVANYQMCSAAYWTGACATEIVASPSASVGSIGVYCVHEDLSAWLEKEGVRLTYISEGKYKVEGNEAEPLSDHARARFQANVKRYYDLFTRDVATGRNVALATVINGYGQGDAVPADEALSLGLIDRIETLEDTVARVLSEPNPGRLAAEAARRELAAQADTFTRMLGARS